MQVLRPQVVKVCAKKRIPSKKNPIKKFLMDIFKIKEIDYEKFRKESKWSIKPQSRPRE